MVRASQNRNWQIRISFCLLVIAAGVSAYYSGKMEAIEACGLNGFSVTFLDTAVFSGLIADQACLNSMRQFFFADFLFIACYFLYLFLWSARRKATYKLFIRAFTIPLVILDLVENMLIVQGEPSTSFFISGVKVLLAVSILSAILLYYLGKLRPYLREIRKTLWYARFSVLALLVVLVFVSNPQGEELYIYLLESDSPIPNYLILNILIPLVGIVIWYFPRYFYPELTEATYSARGLSRIKELTVRNKKLTLSIFNASNWHLRRIRKTKGREKTIQDVLLARKRVPYFLGLTYFLLLFLFFLKISIKSLGSPNVGLNIRAFYCEMIFIGIIAAISLGFNLKYLTKLFSPNVEQAGTYRGKIITIVALLVIVPMLYSLLPSLVSAGDMKMNVEQLFAQNLLSCCYLVLFGIFALNREEPLRRPLHTGTLIGVIVVSIFFLVNIIWGTTAEFFVLNGLSIGFCAILFYYFFFAILADKHIIGGRRTHYLTLVLFIIFVAFLYSTRMDNNHFDVAIKPLEGSVQAPPDTVYIQNWFEHLPDTDRDTLPVFLVAANGGGTMQAYWTASVIAKLDQCSDGKFSRHTIFHTGASGGAVGLGVVSTLLHHGQKLNRNDIDTIYQADYLSGSLQHMLGRDLIFSTLPLDLSGLENRNSWLTKAYGRHLKYALKRTSTLWDSSCWNWLDGTYDQPLYAMNTMRVENAKRYVGSPVKLSMDVGGHFLWQEMAKLDKELNFGDMVMLTNRFPYVNSAAKVGELGHFVDGGYYDNTGLETLEAMLKYLQINHSHYRDSIAIEYHVVHVDFTDNAFMNHLWPAGLPVRAFAENINEMIIPPKAAYESLLVGQVNRRILHMKDKLGNKFHQIYLTPPALYADKYLCLPPSEGNRFYLKLIKNPLARTISRNQQNYVDYILNRESCLSEAELTGCDKRDKHPPLEVLPGNKIDQLVDLVR